MKSISIVRTKIVKIYLAVLFTYLSYFYYEYFQNNDKIAPMSLLQLFENTNTILLLVICLLLWSFLLIKNNSIFILFAIVLTYFFYVTNPLITVVSTRHLFFLLIAIFLMSIAKKQTELEFIKDFLYFFTLFSHLSAGISKLLCADDSWRIGNAVQILLTEHLAHLDYYTDYLKYIPDIYFQILNYSVILFELAAVYFLFVKKQRRYWLYGAFFLHFGILTTTRIWELTLGILMYLILILIIEKKDNWNEFFVR